MSVGKQYRNYLTPWPFNPWIAQMEAKKPRLRRPVEFQNLCRRIRGLPPLLELTPEQKRERRRAQYRAKFPKKERVPKPGRDHGMKQDSRSGCWMVGVPVSGGRGRRRRRWLSTGEKEIGQALKVVDASGIQRLSILARANCLTQDAAQIIMAGERVTCDDAIRRWAADMKMDQARKTHHVYKTCVRQLVARCGCNGKPVSAITREQLYDYVNDMTVKESTRMVRLAAIHSFYRSAAGFGFVVGNIATTVRLNKSLLTVEQRERVPAVPFTEAEYRRIMAHTQVPLFWAWASSLGYWLGLRMVDVCRYEWASMGDDFAVLYPQKTGRKLVLPLHDPLIGSGELRSVFSEMRSLLKPDGPYCFPEAKAAYEKGRMSEHEGGFKAALALCGIEGKTFHGWRHSFKIRLFQSGKSIEEISRLMGHASVAVTEGYGRVSA